MIKLFWNKGLQFIAKDEYDHEMIIDTAKELGGLDQGFRPMDLLLVALAGCMGMDIVSILRKKGGEITKFEMILQGERVSEHPKSYKKITYQIECKGNYKKEDLLRSFELSRDKYCSVLATLRNPPEFEFII